MGRWLVTVTLLAGCYTAVHLAGDAANDDGGSSSAPNVVFVTSSQIMLGHSTAAADTSCNTLAQSAGLPGHYVAWLSTSQVEAKARLGSARGWVRPDGKPFADTVSDIVAGKIFYPATFDESGATVPLDTAIATGTSAAGVDVQGEDCGDDVAAGSSSIVTGFADAGAPAWTAASSESCGLAHVYCFGSDNVAAVSPPAPPTGSLLAFVSTPIAIGTGSSGLDASCTAQAHAHGLGGGSAFVAAVATSLQSIRTHVGDTPLEPWVRLDGVATTTDFTTFDAPLDVDVTGAYVSMSVLTGATGGGVMGSKDCTNWTVSTSVGSAVFGVPMRSSSAAINAGVASCSDPATFYCMQKP